MTEINDHNSAFLPDADEMPEPRTADEIAELKRNWTNDPCWDIEDTEGFEYHYMELRRWREALEDQRRVNEINRVTTRGAHLGFTYDQMRFMENLERQIRTLRQEIDALRQETNP
jgi:hypothetical protein